MVFLIGIAALVTTLLGGLFAMHFRDKLHLILGFSAGAVIAVALFDLLPESVELAAKVYDVRLVAMLIGVGFAAFLTLDRLFSLHLHEQEECEKASHRGKLAAATLAFHSLLDGVGIGLAFKISPTIGWIVTAAVLTHDFSDGINTVNMIVKSHGQRREAITWLIVDALTPAIGVTATLFFTVSEPVLGLILAVFTGFFLYIGASDLIPESHHHHPTFWTTLTTLLGMLVLYAAIHFVG